MKKLWIILGIWVCAISVFAQVPTEPDELYVYDSQNETYTRLETDPSLQELDGALPVDPPLSVYEEPVIAHVINGEDWYQVNGKNFPYSAVTYILTGVEQCSGAMVGRSALLTAAHCVYTDNTHKTLVKPANITVYAGRKGSAIQAKGKQIFVLNGYSQDGDKGFDYAIVILNKPIGDQSGYLGTKHIHFQEGQKIRLIGFPATKTATKPWLSPGQVTQVFESKYRIVHNADTTAGSSGAPILEANGNKIIAINTAETRSNTKKANTAVASDRLLSFIAEHRNKN